MIQLRRSLVGEARGAVYQLQFPPSDTRPINGCLYRYHCHHGILDGSEVTNDSTYAAVRLKKTSDPAFDLTCHHGTLSRVIRFRSFACQVQTLCFIEYALYLQVAVKVSGPDKCYTWEEVALP